MLKLGGKRFGKLVAIEDSGKRKGTSILWLCVCDCGNFVEVISSSLKNGSTKSCGCLSKETTSKRSFKHGHTIGNNRSPTWLSWKGMKSRCSNESQKDYVGPNITYDKRWDLFENFLKDMGERPFGCVLTRKDLKGNYEPKNCTWKPSIKRKRKSGKHKIVGLIDVRMIETRPYFIPEIKPKGVLEKGLVYERKVIKWLKGMYGKRVLNNVWFEFEDKSGVGWCEIDFIILPSKKSKKLIVGEIKLTGSKVAEKELSKLYVPVCKLYWPKYEIVPLIIARDVRLKWEGRIINSVEHATGYETFIWR